MECEHGWRNAIDCDVCTLRRVEPKAADRIAELEAALRPFAALGAAVRFIDDTGHVTLRVRADVLQAAQKALGAK